MAFLPDPNLLILLAPGIVLGTAATYRLQIRAQHVPRSLAVYQGLMVLGIVLALTGLARDPSPLGGITASLAILVGGFFLYAGLKSRLPEKRPSAGVGQPAPDFTARAADGTDFTLSSLKGRTILLKFFRGYW